MEADEEVGLPVVGHGCALVESEGAIIVARQNHAKTESILDHRAQASGDVECDLLFFRALRATDSNIVSAVTGIDHDRLPRASGRDRGAWIRNSAVGASGAGGRGSGLGVRDSEVAAAGTSISTRATLFAVVTVARPVPAASVSVIRIVFG